MTTRVHFCPIRFLQLPNSSCFRFNVRVGGLFLYMYLAKRKRILTNTVFFLDIWYYSDFILYAETRKPTPTTVALVVRISKRSKHRAPIE